MLRTGRGKRSRTFCSGAKATTRLFCTCSQPASCCAGSVQFRALSTTFATVWPEAVHQAAGVGLCEHVGARSEFASILSARVQNSDALLIVVVAILRLVPSSSSRLLACDQGSCLGLASAVVLVLAARLRPGLPPRSRVGLCLRRRRLGRLLATRAPASVSRRLRRVNAVARPLSGACFATATRPVSLQ